MRLRSFGVPGLAAVACLLLAPSTRADVKVVKDLAGLRSALSSDRTIILQAGDYRLEDGLQLDGMHDLVLRGIHREKTRLLGGDGASPVLRIVDGASVRVEGLTLAHGPDAAEGEGAVLVIESSRDVRVDRANLRDAGGPGLVIRGSTDVTLTSSEIRGCGETPLRVEESEGVVVRSTEVEGRELELEGVSEYPLREAASPADQDASPMALPSPTAFFGATASDVDGGPDDDTDAGVPPPPAGFFAAPPGADEEEEDCGCDADADAEAGAEAGADAGADADAEGQPRTAG